MNNYRINWIEQCNYCTKCSKCNIKLQTKNYIRELNTVKCNGVSGILKFICSNFTIDKDKYGRKKNLGEISC